MTSLNGGPDRRVLHLVRHAMPEASANLPAELWPLSQQGRDRAAGLRHSLPGAASVHSSTELKAVETARLAMGCGPGTDARFGEVHRPGEPFDDQARSRRLAWVVGEPDERHRGWESPTLAAARFQEGLDDISARVDAALPLVVATHGMVMTAWLVSVGVVDAGQAAGGFWLDLGFPEVITVAVGT